MGEFIIECEFNFFVEIIFFGFLKILKTLGLGFLKILSFNSMSMQELREKYKGDFTPYFIGIGIFTSVIWFIVWIMIR